MLLFLVKVLGIVDQLSYLQSRIKERVKIDYTSLP